MKKGIYKLLSLLLIVTMIFSFAACGPQVQNGQDGTNGKSAYEIWLDEGNSGTEADFLTWLKAAAGTNGKDGTTPHIGANGHWFIGDFDTGVSAFGGGNGENGITPHIGTNGNWFIGNIDTQIKAQGENGADGESAYQIWLNNGNTGSETDFLNWLKATNGTDGKSAYQIWLDNGNTGSETDFLNWLKGTDGKNGKSAYEIYRENNKDYKKSEAEWIDDLVHGRLARFIVTFDSLGGSAVAPITNILYGNKITAPQNPAKDTWSFVGWFTEPQLLNGWDFNTNAVTAHITLYAKWVVDQAACFVFKADGDQYSVTSLTALGKQQTELFVPEQFNGKAVTKILSFACRDQKNLLNIVIPKSVIEIGRSAFYGCSNLYSMTVPFVGETLAGSSGFTNTNLDFIFGGDLYNSYRNVPKTLKQVTVTGGALGYYAFYFQKNIETITLIDVTAIGANAFASCEFTSIIIPDSVQSIGEEAFSFSEVENVVIGSGVTTIGNLAFRSCVKLERITIPSTVTKLSNTVFQNPNNYGNWTVVTMQAETPPSIASPANGLVHTKVIFVPANAVSAYRTAWPNIANRIHAVGSAVDSFIIEDDTLIAYVGTDSHVTVPDGIITIADSAFCGIQNLVGVTLPEGVTTIGRSAFYLSSNLSWVDLPDSLLSIGQFAFSYCLSLESLDLPLNLTTIQSYAFRYCGITSITIPGNVKTIVAGTFQDATFLKELVLSEGVTAIGSGMLNGGAFSGASIETLTIPSSLTIIGNSAFSGNINLREINFAPNSQLKSIGQYAFWACSSLASITIPASVTDIDNFAFGNCSVLITVYLERSILTYSEITKITANTFIDSNALEAIYVFDVESLAEYQTAANWLVYEKLMSIKQ